MTEMGAKVVEEAVKNECNWTSQQLAEFTDRIGGDSCLSRGDRAILAGVRRRIVNREYAKRSREERKRQTAQLLHRIESLELLNAMMHREIIRLREDNQLLHQTSMMSSICGANTSIY